MLDQPYATLEGLPRSLWLPVLVASSGCQSDKLPHAEVWLSSLLKGQFPKAGANFGAAHGLPALLEVAQRLALNSMTQGRPAQAEQVLKSLLWHLDRLAGHQPKLSPTEAAAVEAEAFEAQWTQEKGDFDEVMTLLQGLGDLSAQAWDALRGRLKGREWQEVEAAATTLTRVPELVALIQRLGRQRPVPAAPALQPQPHEKAGPRPMRWHFTHVPDAPGELLGIRQGARLDTLLASEAAQLRHPVLRKLLRARLAEGRLLTHDTRGVLADLRPDPAGRQPQEAPPLPGPPQGQGPIILCLDTSGSMRGAPERLAKAITLQAFRTVHAQGRGCLLLGFGAAGEVFEHRVGTGADGLNALLDVMGQAFDGGTDVQAPLERAVALVQAGGWSQADLLIVSDGEFGCVPATLELLDDARTRLGLRVQGVLLGDRETMGLMEVCDAIHWVRHWRDHSPAAAQAGHGQGFSPVHHKSLTALFFPNALSPRAARHKPPS
jgi:uncharacterized protein with von Willebrand factor type A (vWA) domain